jgi:S1-C subfamily serine protease
LGYEDLSKLPVALQVRDRRAEEDKVFLRSSWGPEAPESGRVLVDTYWKLEPSSREVVERSLKTAMEAYGYVVNEQAEVTIDIEVDKFIHSFAPAWADNSWRAEIKLSVVVSKSDKILQKKTVTETVEKRVDPFHVYEAPEHLLSRCLSNIVEKTVTDYQVLYAIKKAYGIIVAEAPAAPPGPKKTLASQGTGFLLCESGLVVTNYHVVADRQDLQVILPAKNMAQFEAEVKLQDINNDLAILRLKEFAYEELFSNRIPYPVGNSDAVTLGQGVFTLGFPLGKVLGKSAKFSDGTISSLYGPLDNASLFQISNPIQPGNSGGPLFDRDANLIGVVLASLNAKLFFEIADIIPQNVNFAIKSDYLINLIRMLPENDKILKRPSSLRAEKLQKQVELLVPYIVIVYAN